eukprot:TRINITY_DN4924_c0_g1_i1.p1 TRINITY_DN4924_c0_g1~~TRINITY_DN4924_c0_g1_i1.p1  ORF type:complete len:557 (+),score=69.09 TRINITY_DN4924_c0_g1_i1:84-1673(+)
MWQRHARLWFFHLAWKVVLLLVLLHVGILESSSSVINDEVAYTIVVANLFFEAANITWGLLASQRWAGLPTLKYFSSFLLFDVISWLALLTLCKASQRPQTGQEKVCVAVNILLRSLDVISTLRVLPVVGPMMIAVLQSFAPMQGMFMIMGMMFLTFAFTFLSIKDPGRSNAYVLLNLYQALFLTDSDGAEAISGIDLGHEQTLDFGVEMYSGEGSSWLLGASSYIMVFATSTFSLVLLNLTIGMYSKYYEQMEPFANLAFQQYRARLSVSFMLRPKLPARWLRYSTSLKASRLLSLAAIPFFCTLVFAMKQNLSIIGSAALAALLLVRQAALLTHISDIDGLHHYLWVSYRTDFNEQFFNTQGGEIEGLKNMLSTQREEIAELKGEVAKLSGLQEEFAKLSTQLSETTQVLMESSRDRQSYQKENAQREHTQYAMGNGDNPPLPSAEQTSSIMMHQRAQSLQSIGGSSLASGAMVAAGGRPFDGLSRRQSFAGHTTLAPQGILHPNTAQNSQTGTVTPILSARRRAGH